MTLGISITRCLKIYATHHAYNDSFQRSMNDLLGGPKDVFTAEILIAIALDNLAKNRSTTPDIRYIFIMH